jgi:hypothetical protein
MMATLVLMTLVNLLMDVFLLLFAVMMVMLVLGTVVTVKPDVNTAKFHVRIIMLALLIDVIPSGVVSVKM